MSRQIWTLSNGLSLLRLLLTYPITVVLLGGYPYWMLLALTLVAALTDLFDGIAARKLRQVTDFGKILDPFADKVMVVTISFILMRLGNIPSWFFYAVLVRDCVIFGGGMYLRNSSGVVMQSNSYGKWAVALTAAFLSISVVQNIHQWLYLSLLTGSCVMLFLSFLSYFRRFVKSVRPSTHR